MVMYHRIRIKPMLCGPYKCSKDWRGGRGGEVLDIDIYTVQLGMKYLPTCDVHAAQPVIGFRPRISHLANLCPIFGTFQEQEINNL